MESYQIECPACGEFIDMAHCNCPECGVFMMYIDFEFLQQKMEGYSMLAEHRTLSEDRLERLKMLSVSWEEIQMEKAKMEARRSELVEFIMERIEDREKFLLN